MPIDPSSFKLVGIMVFVRHGECVPVGWCPAKSPSQWEKGGAACYPGQLTKKGENQMFTLGQAFRNRYVDQHKLLEKTFRREQFELEATPNRQTLESINWFIRGMYSDWDVQHAIVVHRKEREGIFIGCPEYEALFSPLQKSLWEEEEKNASWRKDFEPYFHIITSEDGKLLSGHYWPYQLYDYLQILASFDPHLVAHIPEASMEALCQLAVKLCYGPISFSRELLRIAIGQYMMELLEFFHQRMANEYGDPKMRVYCAHDNIIAALLIAFDIFDNKCPSFAVPLTFELWKDEDSGNWFVRIYYDEKICSSSSFEFFAQRATDLVPI